MARVQPAEIVVNPEMANDLSQMNTIKEKYGSFVTVRELVKREVVVDGFSELDKKDYAQDATMLLLSYIEETVV